MKNNLKSILNDLYTIDPELKKHEKELQRVIQKLLEAKPDLKIDQAFVKELRVQLEQEATQMTEGAAQAPEETSKHSTSLLSKIFFPFAGGILATLLVVIVINTVRPKYLNEGDGMVEGESPFALKTQIVALEPGAFGPLSNVSVGVLSNVERDSATFDQELDEANPQQAPSMAGVNETQGDASQAEGEQITTDSMPEEKERMMIWDPEYVPTIYQYVYKGQPVELPEETVNVFKRIPQKASSQGLANTLLDFGFGLMDLAAFNNTSVDQIQLSQHQKLGYSVTISFLDSSIQIYQNWQEWDYPGSNCGEDYECYENSQLKESDLPTDEALFAMADDFLERYQINLENYGDPVINKYWERELLYAQQEGIEPRPYVPTTISLIYPLKLDGDPVFDQWGNPVGLSVEVDIYNKKVASLYGLQAAQYQSSAYESVNDWQTVVDYLAKGASPYGEFYQNQPVNYKEIELGTPETVLVNFWHYSEGEEEGVQLYSPALKFPIVQPEGEYIYQDYLVVPLAKELLQNSNLGGSMPMPLMLEEAVENKVISDPPPLDVDSDEPRPSTSPSTPAVLPPLPQQ